MVGEPKIVQINTKGSFLDNNARPRVYSNFEACKWVAWVSLSQFYTRWVHVGMGVCVSFHTSLLGNLEAIVGVISSSYI